MMHQELVERKRWINERRFLHALNYCMLLPGPEAQQLATYIGWLMQGTLDSSLPDHARFQWARVWRFLAVGLSLWFVVMAALVATHGWDSTLAKMGWLFSEVALLTFGGANAVLPYVYQGGVETYQWLTANQMMDGLALGETTPGLLIMVGAFVRRPLPMALARRRRFPCHVAL